MGMGMGMERHVTNPSVCGNCADVDRPRDEMYNSNSLYPRKLNSIKYKRAKGLSTRLRSKSH